MISKVILPKGQVSIKKKLFITVMLAIFPCLSWLLLKASHSPWWFENAFSTPLIIVPICILLMLVFIRFLSWQNGCVFLLINVILALYLNGSATVNRKDCANPITFFQFNLKFNEGKHELTELIEFLKTENYHLITLQGVSLKYKRFLIEELSPYFPYFVNSNSMLHVHSDQLLFSRYAFHQVKYFKSGQSAFLITSQWQLPNNEISLFALHPPSPRTELLWQLRNKTLYQLKYALSNSSIEKSIVIGDLNLSKHSKRIDYLVKGMETVYVNSWPNIPYIPALFGVAIDHLWVSNHNKVCYRDRINQLNWSDHYPIQTHISFFTTQKH